jgi:hypothetical protein
MGTLENEKNTEEPSRRRLYVYWSRAGRAPVPGEAVTLEDGRTGVLDTAKASDGAVEKRKLTVLLDEQRTVTSEGVPQ